MIQDGKYAFLASSKIYKKEYNDNNESIFLCSLGAAIQNIQLGVTAEGLTSAWLSGAGERRRRL